MQNDSTIPARLDPTHTVPAPLSGVAPLQDRGGGEPGNPALKLVVGGAVVIAVLAAARYAGL